MDILAGIDFIAIWYGRIVIWLIIIGLCFAVFGIVVGSIIDWIQRRG